MQPFKPRSILQLTITGFLTVAGLLILALVTTARQLDALGEQSQRVVNQSVAAIRQGRILMEQSWAMERNVRQYQVLGDPQILLVYEGRRHAFIEAALALDALSLDDDQQDQIYQLLDQEQGVFDVVRMREIRGDADALLPALVNSTQAIAAGIDEWTNRQLDDIREETLRSRRMLTIQALVLTVAALMMAGIFTALITRPLAQVNRAINRLGDGSTSTPVRISGPTDLMLLGERLEWLRERLQTLEQQRSAFLRHVSHELKTPLAAIQESAALLNEGVVGGLTARQRDILQIQHNNCQRLSALINELLRHHENSFAVLDALPTRVRLDSLVESVLAAQELALRTHSIRLLTNLAPLEVRGNAEQLRVVVDNLVSNAIRYSPREGILTVSLWSEDGAAHCEVRDDGPGVAPQDAPHVFDAFYRGVEAEAGPYPGTGLGLAIAEEYAKANQGTLLLVPREGNGAVFRLSLPLI